MTGRALPCSPWRVISSGSGAPGIRSTHFMISTHIHFQSPRWQIPRRQARKTCLRTGCRNAADPGSEGTAESLDGTAQEFWLCSHQGGTMSSQPANTGLSDACRLECRTMQKPDAPPARRIRDSLTKGPVPPPFKSGFPQLSAARTFSYFALR